MKRRRFIGLIGAAAGVAAAFFFVRREEVRHSRFAQSLAERLSYLKIDMMELEVFLREDLARKELDNSLDEVARRFLLSTDFFSSGMDEKKQIRYQGRFDPYKRVCANPFSATYYPGNKPRESA
jgi:hypothetical protein